MIVTSTRCWICNGGTENRSFSGMSIRRNWTDGPLPRVTIALAAPPARDQVAGEPSRPTEKLARNLTEFWFEGSHAFGREEGLNPPAVRGAFSSGLVRVLLASAISDFLSEDRDVFLVFPKGIGVLT